MRTPTFLIGLLIGTAPGISVAEESANPADVFNERILPIFQSESPSSCVQCHLASVDLKDYILPSSEQTFVSLRDQGLVDLADPQKSKILKLIRMGQKDADPGARLIHEKQRRAELTAFAAWITACAADESLRSLPAAKTLAKPAAPNAVIRHARRSRIVDSFVRNVWSQRMRCFPCHTPHEIDADNPKHKIARRKQTEFAKKYDRTTLQRLHFFKKTPEETLDYLLSDSRTDRADRLPLINIAKPRQSLLILKPTSKLPRRNADKTFTAPSYREPVSHMGGLKMHKDDQSYKSVLAWIQDYSQLTQGRYTSVKDLPADNWYPTQKVVRLRKVPDRFPVGTVFQIFVYSEASTPIAFTQGTVTPRRIVNGALFMLGGIANTAGKTPVAAPLVPLNAGQYTFKIYADLNNAIDTAPTHILSERDFVNSIEKSTNWPDGFRNATVLDGSGL